MTIYKDNMDLNELKKNININYRTANMEKPKIYYQRSPEQHPGKVALMAQFFPTFEAQTGVTGGNPKLFQ